MTANELLLLLLRQHYRVTHVQHFSTALKPQITSQKKKIEIDIKMEI